MIGLKPLNRNRTKNPEFAYNKLVRDYWDQKNI